MAVVVDTDLPPAYVNVYNALREAILNHGICPSQKELYRATGYTIETIRRAYATLHRKGYIQRGFYKARSVTLPDPSLVLSLKPLAPWEEDLNIPRVWAD